MRVIDAEAKIFRPEIQDDDFRSAAFKTIAFAGRICYKSEGSTPEDDKAFIRRIIKSKHEAVLEHGNIILRCTGEMMRWIREICNIAEVCFKRKYYLRFTEKVVSGNVRAWRDFFKALKIIYPYDLAHFYPLMCAYDVLFEDLWNPSEDTVGPLNTIGEWEEITADELEESEIVTHRCETVHFIVDRGISHEIVRHRPASFCQESTRYCNYSQGKFGSQITFIAPSSFKSGTSSYGMWEWACMMAEKAYFDLLHIGELPEMARDVLPNSTKTEVVMTTHVGEWQHFLRLRALGVTGRPHPQMLEVAVPLLRQFQNMLPSQFENLREIET